jgi:hypothetical protein
MLDRIIGDWKAELTFYELSTHAHCLQTVAHSPTTALGLAL